MARTRLTDTTSGFRGAGPRGVRLFAVHYPAEYLGDTVESLVIAPAQRPDASSRSVCRCASAPRGRPSQGPLKAAVYLLRACLALLISLTRRRTLVGPTEAVVV